MSDIILFITKRGIARFFPVNVIIKSDCKYCLTDIYVVDDAPAYLGQTLLCSGIVFASCARGQRLVALYQITVVHGGRHLDKGSVLPEIFPWLLLINSVTVD